MNNSTDTIGDRTRDLLTCSVVPQPTASPRAPPKHVEAVKSIVPWLVRKNLVSFYIVHVRAIFYFKVHPRTGQGSPKGE
jgi:hypothetical protein